MSAGGDNSLASTTTTGRAEAIALICILGLTIVAYLPAIGAGTIWDDDVHIAKSSLHSINGLRLIWTDPTQTQQYYPLAHTGFWLQWLLWGERPMGYHIVNVLLHSLNAMLLWRVLRRLGLAAFAAVFAAAIFAVHPVHVESVAWITELKNTLMGAFCLLSLLAYMRCNPVVTSLSRPPLRWGWYIGALVLYACALLSKTVAATMPAAILVIIWWRRGRLDIGRDVLPLLPWFAIGAGLGWMIVHFEQVYWGSRAENFGGEFFTWTASERLIVAGRCLWFYAGKLVWPAPLAFFYQRWPIDGHDWRQWLWPACAVALVVLLWLFRRRIGRGPLAAVLLFGGVMFPALGFFNLFWQIYSYVADHMQYMPSLGVIALVACGCGAIGERLPRSLRMFGLAMCGAVVLMMAGMTWSRCHVYQNLETLYTDTIAKSPDSWLSNYNLGLEMNRAGRRDRAEQLFRRAIEIRPRYDDAHYVLGNVLADKGGDFRHEAVEQFQRAIDLYALQAAAQRAFAAQVRAQGRDREAARHNGFAMAFEAKQARAEFNKGNVLGELRRVDDAITAYRRASELDPGFAEPLDALGTLYAQAGRIEDAASAYRQAVAINPDSASMRFNLGSLLSRTGSSMQAAVELRQALRLDRRSMFNRVRAVAQLAAQQGRHADAVRYYDLLLEIAPEDAVTRADRDRAAMMGRSDGR